MPDGSTTPRSTYDIIMANGPRLIEATHAPTGIRSRFATDAICEEGKGWTLRDVDGKVGGMIPDTDLVGAVGLSITRAQATAQRRWTRRAANSNEQV